MQNLRYAIFFCLMATASGILATEQPRELPPLDLTSTSDKPLLASPQDAKVETQEESKHFDFRVEVLKIGPDKPFSQISFTFAESDNKYLNRFTTIWTEIADLFLGRILVQAPSPEGKGVYNGKRIKLPKLYDRKAFGAESNFFYRKVYDAHKNLLFGIIQALNSKKEITAYIEKLKVILSEIEKQLPVEQVHSGFGKKLLDFPPLLELHLLAQKQLFLANKLFDKYDRIVRDKDHRSAILDLVKFSKNYPGYPSIRSSAHLLNIGFGIKGCEELAVLFSLLMQKWAIEGADPQDIRIHIEFLRDINIRFGKQVDPNHKTWWPLFNPILKAFPIPPPRRAK